MLMFTSLVDGRVRTVTNCSTSRRATVTPHPTCSWKSQDSNLLSPKAPVLQTGPALQRWRTSLWKRMGSNHHLPGFNRPLYPRAALPFLTIRSCDHRIHPLARRDSNPHPSVKSRVVFHTTSKPLCGADGDRTRELPVDSRALYRSTTAPW